MVNEIKVKEEDLKKVLEVLSKDCPSQFIKIVINYPKIHFISDDGKGNIVELIIRDQEHYMSPSRVKQEPL